jgi:hypothetical protein
MFGLLYLCSRYAKLDCAFPFVSLPLESSVVIPLVLFSHDNKFERLRRAIVTELPADDSGVSCSKATLLSVQG